MDQERRGQMRTIEIEHFNSIPLLVTVLSTPINDGSLNRLVENKRKEKKRKEKERKEKERK